MSTIPLIASVNDLEGAIRHGSRNPSSRWYIAKRAEALGFGDLVPTDWAVVAAGLPDFLKDKIEERKGGDGGGSKESGGDDEGSGETAGEGDKKCSHDGCDKKAVMFGKCKAHAKSDAKGGPKKKATTASGLPGGQADGTMGDVDDPITAAGWANNMHPRDRKGRFIDKMDIINVFSVDNPSEPSERGKAIATRRNPSTGQDEIQVSIPRGKAYDVQWVPVDRIESAPDAKARLDGVQPEDPGMEGRPADVPTYLGSEDPDLDLTDDELQAMDDDNDVSGMENDELIQEYGGTDSEFDRAIGAELESRGYDLNQLGDPDADTEDAPEQTSSELSFRERDLEERRRDWESTFLDRLSDQHDLPEDDRAEIEGSLASGDYESAEASLRAARDRAPFGSGGVYTDALDELQSLTRLKYDADNDRTTRESGGTVPAADPDAPSYDSWSARLYDALDARGIGMSVVDQSDARDNFDNGTSPEDYALEFDAPAVADPATGMPDGVSLRALDSGDVQVERTGAPIGGLRKRDNQWLAVDDRGTALDYHDSRVMAVRSVVDAADNRRDLTPSETKELGQLRNTGNRTAAQNNRLAELERRDPDRADPLPSVADRTAPSPAEQDRLAEEAAWADQLGLDTLETRNSDGLDFHEVSRQALDDLAKQVYGGTPPPSLRPDADPGLQDGLRTAFEKGGSDADFPELSVTDIRSYLNKVAAARAADPKPSEAGMLPADEVSARTGIGQVATREILAEAAKGDISDVDATIERVQNSKTGIGDVAIRDTLKVALGGEQGPGPSASRQAVADAKGAPAPVEPDMSAADGSSLARNPFGGPIPEPGPAWDAKNTLGVALMRAADKSSHDYTAEATGDDINRIFNEPDSEAAHRQLAQLMTRLKLGGKQRKRYRELLDAYRGDGSESSASDSAAATADALRGDNPVKDRLAARAAEAKAAAPAATPAEPGFYKGQFNPGDERWTRDPASLTPEERSADHAALTAELNRRMGQSERAGGSRNNNAQTIRGIEEQLERIGDASYGDSPESTPAPAPAPATAAETRTQAIYRNLADNGRVRYQTVSNTGDAVPGTVNVSVGIEDYQFVKDDTGWRPTYARSYGNSMTNPLVTYAPAALAAKLDEANAEAIRRDTLRRGGVSVPRSQVQVGDRVLVGGELVAVTGVDPKTGYPILANGGRVSARDVRVYRGDSGKA